MKHLLYILCISILISCSSNQKRPLLGDSEFQRTINAEFKDASTSPLKAKDLKNFTTLDFFDIDSTFIVTATLKRTPETSFFNMKTTTDRLTEERVFGVLSFELKGKPFTLKVYQGKELMKKEEYKDYLFLPFLDHTNGESTYGGGRYLDLRIPETDTIVLDFNSAYNPYCAYNDKYSCPIPPRENYLDLEVTAGVKAFKKD